MSDKKQDSFTVTDRRLFTSEGERRQGASEETVSATPAPEPPPIPAPVESSARLIPTPEPTQAGEERPPMPPPPTDLEQQAQADAYRKSAKELEMTFERFMASLYMTAMLQLGLMHEEGGQPRVDLIGARQTIDTLTLLSDKTKGNLSTTEQNFLQNCLYELRMAYVEVTNAIARPPQAPIKNTGTD